MAPAPVAGPSGANAAPTFTLNNTIIASFDLQTLEIRIDSSPVQVQACQSVQKCGRGRPTTNANGTTIESRAEADNWDMLRRQGRVCHNRS